MLQLTTLGSIDLTAPDRGSLRTLLAQPKRLALLVFLCVEAPAAYVRRDTLLGLFWPDADETRARAALRQALQFLRRTLGDEVLVTRGEEEVGIDAARLHCDATDFLAAAGRGDWDTALRRHGGEFLAGFAVDDCAAFDQWVAARRLELRQAALRLCATGAERLAPSDPAAALQLRERALALDPLDEVAARALAQAHHATGNVGAALAVLGAVRDRLLAELDVSPSAETLALEQRLRQPAPTPPASPSASAVPSATAPPTAVTSTTGVSPSQEPADTAVERTLAPAPGAIARPPGGWSRAGVAVAVGLCVAAVAVSIATMWRAPTSTPTPTPATPTSAPRVVVEPFSNQTGDSTLASLGSMVADWITEGVSRLDGVSVVPLTALTAVRSADGRDNGPTSATGLSPTAAAMARDMGATVLVSGSAYRTGATLHLQARVHDVASGALRHPPEIISVPVDSVMTGIDRLRSRVVGMLAPLTDTVSHLRRAIAPPSYEVYRDYVTGLERFVRGDMRTALALFERAAQVDTAYPMPRIAAVMALANLGAYDSAAHVVAGLRTSRVRLGPLERATLDMADGLLRGDLAQLEAASVVQGRIAPGTIGDYMVAESARRRGAPRRAVTHLRSLDPQHGELRGWSTYWEELTGSLHMMRAYDEEVREARQALAQYPDAWVLRAGLVRALSASGRPQAADSAVASWSARTPGDSVALADVRYTGWTTLAANGDAPAAARWRAAEGAVLAGLRSSARRAGVRWRHARQLFFEGAAVAARDSLRALTAGDTADVRAAGLLAAVAARLRDDALLESATAMLARADAARSATVRAMEGQDGDWWRAIIAAQRGDAATAISLLTAVYAAGRSRDITLADDPFFAGIRRDAAFVRLVTYAR